ncbi:hypothetical protein C8F04DRAFT_732933 [Mycena alexandri]|uniref:Uncharacterized protein n=1 Tax=Mycena alexandri TaxID=1745969 RepID=A0AAD6WWV9_9AGAR|nr:hypothetical protein C8F04DRAFT_732933 [Mycena alexandri]
MDYFKLHRADAVLRIRRNVFALLLIAVLSTLVPRIPALPTALAVALSSRRYRWWTAAWLYSWFCMIEVGAVVLLSLNILQAAYAIKYPRAPLALSPSPAKPKGIHMAPPTPQRSFRLSPNSSPQPQKSFSFSASGSALQSSSSAGSLSLSTYPSSPLSTPSRVLHYSLPPGASTSSTSTFAASSLNTPSPILSTYLGKHGAEYTARPFDGAFLAEIRNHPDSDDE